MSRTDFRRPTGWLVRLRFGKTARIAAVSLGLGLGTAFAADAVRLSIPEATLTEAANDADLDASQWRVFDPGFIADHLPFKLTIGQTISYNDNVQNTGGQFAVLANNNGLLRLPSRGDFISDTTISGASRFPMGAQTFFFNGTYAPRRYFTDTQLDADNYAVNGGVDFNIADRCSGRLIGGVSENQSPQEETAGFGVNNVSTTSFNETARCQITGHISGLFNSGYSISENEGDASLGNNLLSFALNNYTQRYIGVGLQYDLSGLDSLRGVATFTQRDFTDRPVGLGLAQETHQNDFLFFYDRTLSAKLDISASGGITVFDTGLSAAELVEPNYAFSIRYRPTPKISAAFSESRATGAPQSVIADVNTTDSQSVSVSYRYSPKVNVTGILSHSKSRNPTLAGSVLGITLPQAFANVDSNNASMIVSYAATPLVSATASYTYSERTDTSRSGINAVSNIFRVGLFYTR